MEITNKNFEISTETKEACAIETMHYMLQRYASENDLTFEEAMLKFASSSTYEVLFDFETAVWKEGPDYLLCLFERALEK